MKDDFRYGKLKYISFILLNMACLIVSNYLAYKLYLEKKNVHFTLSNYKTLILIMLLIDLLVTIGFNTLKLVLRRKSELLPCLKHVALCFVILSVVLFSLRQGALYSRATVYLAYSIDFALLCISHFIWKNILKVLRKRNKTASALLMTTDRFAEDGIFELVKARKDLKYLYLLKNINVTSIKGIEVIKSVEEVAAIICWEWIDIINIYGVDQQMIPEKLINSCKDMGLKVEFVDLNYRIIDVKTIKNEDPKYGALSFLEVKRDVPFPIRRVYWITETEANLHRGFHAHKLNCQLLFCPYGAIDIILDDGKEKRTVRLDEPGKGLLLMPGLWREMVWKKSGSVLCVLASEYYDEKEYIRNYDEFIAYDREYDTEVLEVTHITE